jgi:hypothetical protein
MHINFSEIIIKQFKKAKKKGAFPKLEIEDLSSET